MMRPKIGHIRHLASGLVLVRVWTNLCRTHWETFIKPPSSCDQKRCGRLTKCLFFWVNFTRSIQFGRCIKKIIATRRNSLKHLKKNARKHLPQEIQRTVQDLLTDFQLLVNGPFKMLWWKFTGCCYPWFRDRMNHEIIKGFEEDRQAVIMSVK